jgi:hypothetical protein
MKIGAGTNDHVTSVWLAPGIGGSADHCAGAGDEIARLQVKRL